MPGCFRGVLSNRLFATCQQAWSVDGFSGDLRPFFSPWLWWPGTSICHLQLLFGTWIINSSVIWHILPFPPAWEGKPPSPFCTYWWFCSLGPSILVSQRACARVYLSMCVCACACVKTGRRIKEGYGAKGFYEMFCEVWYREEWLTVDKFSRCPAACLMQAHFSSEPSTMVHPCLIASCTFQCSTLIRALWLPPSGALPPLMFRAHLAVQAHPKCRPRSSTGPSLLMALDSFTSSVDFFVFILLQLAKMLLLLPCPSPFRRTETWSQKQQATRIWLAV